MEVLLGIIKPALFGANNQQDNTSQAFRVANTSVLEYTPTLMRKALVQHATTIFFENVHVFVYSLNMQLLKIQCTST